MATPLTAAQRQMNAARNAQGAALLKSQEVGTYKPPTPTPATNKTTAGATTLARGASDPNFNYNTGTYKTGTLISSVGLGNQKVGISSGSPGGGTTRTTSIDPGLTPPTGYDYSGVELGGDTSVDLTDTYNNLSEAQLTAQRAALQTQLNNSLGNLDEQQASISPYYYDKRNQAAARSDVGAMNFAQRAAARGIQGNAGQMPEIYRENALQGQIGALDQAEAGAFAGIERDRSNLRNNYESDLVSTQAGIEAQNLQNAINQMNADRSYSLDEAGVTGTFNGQQTMQGQAQQLSNAKAQLEIDAQEIQNSYLPQTLKDEAERLRLAVQQDRIDIDTASAQLRKIRSSANGTTGGLSQSMALDMWNSGIDTPAIRQALGM